jgi:hypothetical protein
MSQGLSIVLPLLLLGGNEIRLKKKESSLSPIALLLHIMNEEPCEMTDSHCYST